MRRFFSLVASVLLIAGCSGIEIETLRDKPLLMEGKSTYRWSSLPGRDHPGTEETPQEKLHAIFRQAVDRHMANKGYTRVATGETPDLELDYRILILPDKRELSRENGDTLAEYGIEWRFDRGDISRPRWRRTESRNVELFQKGRLVLGAIDTRTGNAIWLRAAEKPLEPESPWEDKVHAARQMADKLMKGFPKR